MVNAEYRPFDAHYRSQIAELIKENGFAPAFLAKSCEIPGFEEVPCGYLSTIGLNERGWPELVVTGIVPMEDLAMILNAVVSYWEEYGVTTGIIDMLPTCIDVDQEFAMYGRVNIVPVIGEHADVVHGNERYYGLHHMVQYFQVIWSDEELILPNEEGYDETLHQPILTGRTH